MHFFFILLCLLWAGCGKKPRSLIPQQAQSCKPALFSVPRAKRLRAISTTSEITLQWEHILDERLYSYAIYKFAKGRFLRHKPYAIVIAQERSFTDQTPYKYCNNPCYAIRPCYLINGYLCKGALSNVICFQKKKCL